MKIVALYKTFDGGEFVDASLESIYDHCEHIVMVHSDISWLGDEGNTVKDAAIKWCEQYDKAGKVHHLDVHSRSQEEQYARGVDYIEKHKLLYDVVLAVDADEVWEDQYFERAEMQIRDNPFPAFRCGMHTYLKTPFFRIEPPFGSPIAFLRDPRKLTESPRGCRTVARHLDNVWMHHFTYVRRTRADVERKIHQSCKADGNETVIKGWMEDVYDRLPEFGGDGLHSFERHRKVWQGIQKIWMCDLPPAMLSAKLLRLWLPTFGDTLLAGEMSAIYRLAYGKRQAVDLGTYKGLSAVTLALACRWVHTIDAYEDVPYTAFADTIDPGRYHGGISGHSLYRTQELADRYGNITCEKGETVKAADSWNRGVVDVLMVDADHSEEGTQANVDAWRRHMRPGSVYILHDDNEIHPGVQAVVNRMCDDPKLKRLDPGEWSGSLAAFEVLS